eukprot:comp22182_c0_seq1/m.32585 comp22182_c0_seq1/g.32585  ORF comp22182_c0_seq1/g.32585 comp22182_c0_seq1/m.32585 type:complete len:388 (-) comp22182_c0_seq1:76-1239(-)
MSVALTLFSAHKHALLRSLLSRPLQLHFFKHLPQQNIHTKTTTDMDLKEVVSRLDGYAPLPLAESWDNVGLLVEPSAPHQVSKMLLTIDLTERVLDEAIAMKANFILSYHPPIFSALKRLTQGPEKQRIVIRAIEEKIAVYSPHTAYDALCGGVNDWLAGAVGPQEEISVQPLSTYLQKQSHTRQLTASVSQSDISAIENSLHPIAKLAETVPLEGGKTLVRVNCGDGALADVFSSLTAAAKGASWQIQELLAQPLANTGTGRLVKLKEPISVEEFVRRVKKHLNLPNVRLAMPSKADVKIQTVGICAGSGSSVLRGVRADAYLTGEMGHHDVLEANSRGVLVVLCEHTNTERGFLSASLKNSLEILFEKKVEVVVSVVDADPLVVV